METKNQTYKGTVTQYEPGKWMWEISIDGKVWAQCYDFETEADAFETLANEMSDH